MVGRGSKKETEGIEFVEACPANLTLVKIRHDDNESHFGVLKTL